MAALALSGLTVSGLTVTDLESWLLIGSSPEKLSYYRLDWLNCGVPYQFQI
jgi:hypothetical protein